MNPGQQKFHAFILERVQADQKATAARLLAESFQKQDDRSFDKTYLVNDFMPSMRAIVKPEHLAEVEAIMEAFAGKIRK